MHQPLFNDAYIRSVWVKDFEVFKISPEAEALLERLKNWASKDWQKESASEAAFIEVFFKKTWGYSASGEGNKDEGYTLKQQYPVKGAGQKGGTGKADIALGYFARMEQESVPQVLGEFKDDRSGLDKPQKNRPNDRSPVDQCLDYLREARTGLISPILPTWGIVTDMNEFRLYIWGNKAQYQRFFLSSSDADQTVSLLDDTEEAAFQRFLFSRMFHIDWLLTNGGPSFLQQFQNEQIVHEQALEAEFYQEYQAFRETIYQALRGCNPQYEHEGKLRILVKFTQRILDRCLFVLYCEDMGRQLDFPPNALRDVLIDVARNKYYSSEGDQAWNWVKQIFVSMRDGTPFGSERINRFNGGLFAEDPEMDALNIPNRVFCENNQGMSANRLKQFPKTLLYFSAKYNFGATEKGHGKTLSLTAMGRIFEQSITDLEVMEAHAQGRESLMELSKRKRDGVYYTPEWVTQYIVEETVGARLSEIRKELGFDEFDDVTDEEIRQHRNDGRKAKRVGEYEKALRLYAQALDDLKIVDPACGSGAFLVQAFTFLCYERQRMTNEFARVSGEVWLFDAHEVMRAVLSTNLYGVDINAESVEITKLALWLHTALPNQPLASLDHNIRCGNSLIGHDFYNQMDFNRELFPMAEQDRVNTFDWQEAFPEVFGRENAGFDCVIGNPPYVKLQHFRKIQEDVARYLLEAKNEDGTPLYQSTQTGNFDMYLPFIERAVELLNEKGKMGYIAPNVWMVNNYGRGLRRKLLDTRCLDRWVDFKSFQVFDEAITYTALQFFTGSPKTRIRCLFAPQGKEDISVLGWREVKDAASYHDLPEDDSWVLMPNAERNLHSKLIDNCSRLDESCEGIAVGIQTSADYIYHLERIGTNRYLNRAKGKKEPVEVEIEDAIMHPLVSGPEAKRYQVPDTSIYLLHPYKLCDGKAVLFTKRELETRFPNAKGYLKRFEKDLREREKGKMNRDNSWWAYNYPKNLDKQDIAKLCVAQTVPGMRVCYDSEGAFYLNNVRVNGIIPSDILTGWFLLGVLNSPTCNYIFKRIAKPKAGGYFEANKQFIAPLPIPKTTEEEKAKVAELAEVLQGLHTKRRDMRLMIHKRLESTQCRDDKRDESWLWAEVKSSGALKREAPKAISGRERTVWAKENRERLLRVHLDKIDPVLRPGARLTVAYNCGEIKVQAEGHTVLDGVFVDEADFIAAQWRQKTRQTRVTEKFNAKKLVGLLLKLRKTENEALKRQVVQIDADIQVLDEDIAAAETEMNQLTYRLYNLSDEEIRLVEKG